MKGGIPMLHENIKYLRRRKALSQQDLASRLHVVRQTVSKWEKGYSVPDAEMLIKLAAALDVSVTELLSAELDPPAERDRLADMLAQINEQLAQRNRRSKRTLTVLGAAALLALLLCVAWVCLGVYGMRNMADLPAYVCIDGVDYPVDRDQPPIENPAPSN